MAVVFYSWRQAVLKSKLAATTKHVLVTLGCHMNDMGESCFPSIETLMEETSLSNRAIITHLDKAEQAGFIVTRKHGFAGQKWARNEYVATFPNVEISAENEADLARKVVNDVHHLEEKAVNVVHEGSEPHDKKAVNVVHTSSSIDLSINNTARETVSEDTKVFPTPQGEYACRLIEVGVAVTSMHPTLLGWVQEKIPIDFILQCVGIARQSKPEPERIAANYLDKIIRSEAKPKTDNSWKMTEAGWIAKGKEFGVVPKIGESMDGFKSRVSVAVNGKGEQ